MKNLSIAIPASIISDIPHLREKTSRIGLIGRTAAIFRVDEIIIYPDKLHANQTEDIKTISTLLSYMETPQYLRKALFKLNPILQYAGILPPLRTPHHTRNRKSKDLKIGEYREGITVSKVQYGMMIDIGIEQPVLARNVQLSIGKRVTTRITQAGKKIEVEVADENQISAYWGYKVTVEKHSLGKILKDTPFDLRIATSKYGEPFHRVSQAISEKWAASNRILVIFGSPSTGLNDIVAQEGLHLDELVHFTVNTIPMQGTETVRTEEALIATLACFNALIPAEAT